MSEGMHPDAHPTAPGGMSRKALIKELVDEHTYEDGPEWDDVTWPALIQLVIEERKAREAERPEPEADDPHRFCDHDSDHCQANVDDADQPEDVDDLDDLLAELDEPEVSDASDTSDLLDAVKVAEFHATYGGPDNLRDLVEKIDTDWLDPEAMFAELSAARAEHEAENPPLFIGLPVVRDYIFDGHAGAGPSASERWIGCTMSLTASRRFLETLSPNQQRAYAESGTAARQGTTAHAVGEAEANHMLGRIDEDELNASLLELTVNPIDEDEAYSDEMAEYVAEYVDLVRSYAQERGSDAVSIENRVEAVIGLNGLHEGEVYVVRGSADLYVKPLIPGKGIKPEMRTLVVGDLKYGTGIDVDVDENPQIRLYALGVLGEMADADGNLPAHVDTVVYHIIQPRLGGIKTWSESVDDLLTWRDEVLSPALTLSLYPDEGATFAPSDVACQWCPARGTCPALVDLRMSQADELFDVIVEAEFADGPGAFPETVTLSNERLGSLLRQAEDIKRIYSDLREEAQRRLHRGTAVPGYQLVNYTPARSWDERAEQQIEVDEALTAQQKASLFTEPTLVSPTQAEKVLGKEGYPLIMDLVVKPDKRPVIAREGDRRKTWEGRPPEAMFDDETGGETDG